MTASGFGAPCGVVIGQGPHSTRVTDLLKKHLEFSCTIAQFPTTADFLQSLEAAGTQVADRQVQFVVAMIGDDTPTADQVLRPLESLEPLRNTRFMVLCTDLEISGVQWLTDAGRLDWVGYAPTLQEDAFMEDVRAQLIRFQEHQKQDSKFMVSSLFDLPDSDATIVGRVLTEIEKSLGEQPRILLPPGVRLTTKGQWLEEVTIILDGRVALIHQMPCGEDIVMHEESTGRIIGLLAVSEGRRALLNAVTTTNVVAVRLTVEQLNSSIRGHPDITLLVATLFIRSLDRRLRRAEELHVQNAELSEQLEKERRDLEAALSNLEQARTELSAQERLASLGALSAGVAHELNNPMAAISRISQYLEEDVRALLESSPNPDWATFTKDALSSGRHSTSLPSKAERQLRKQLTELTGDPEVARRLTLAGIHDLDLARRLQERSDVSLEDAERAASIGTQLRNLSSATTRITELVSSLRSYARPDGDTVMDVVLHDNLEDAIRLLSHKLDGVKVRRDFGDIPPIEGHPGQLAQVWTNLLTNAAEAICDTPGGALHPAGAEPLGTVTISTSTPKPGWVRVEVADDGPGIPDAILPQIFEPRFTTKSGQVRFGMGIGLGVSRTIVGGHHGTMRICTSPDGTTIVVDLPVRAPKEEQ